MKKKFSDVYGEIICEFCAHRKHIKKEDICEEKKAKGVRFNVTKHVENQTRPNLCLSFLEAPKQSEK